MCPSSLVSQPSCSLAEESKSESQASAFCFFNDDSRRRIWRFDRLCDFWYFVEGSTNSAERKKYEFKVLISFPVEGWFIEGGGRMGGFQLQFERVKREYKIFAKFSPYSTARIIIPWLGQFSRLSTISVLKGNVACICIPFLKHSICW